MICMFFCFKQKTAYEMRISDWSSDVCSSDLQVVIVDVDGGLGSDRVVVNYNDALTAIVISVHDTDDAGSEDLSYSNRSEERRVGKEGVSTCRFRWSPYH